MVKYFFFPVLIIVFLGLAGCTSANSAGSNEAALTTTAATDMESMQQEMLEQLAAEGIITQLEAGAFSQAHDKLLAAGLMQ